MARNVIDILDDLAAVNLKINECDDNGESGEATLRRLINRRLELQRELVAANPRSRRRRRR